MAISFPKTPSFYSIRVGDVPALVIRASLLHADGMHHDPVRYPEPHVFNPDRYLDDELSTSDSANLADPFARDHWVFGAGRRICPGINVAEREIFLTVARMLWCFRMEEVPGEPIDLRVSDCRMIARADHIGI